MDRYIIADNEECISFDYFMNRLFEIINDCNHENYLGEVIIPFLRSCCIEGQRSFLFMMTERLGLKQIMKQK